ncbi:MAG: glycosyltransferase family 4 protein [Candidatus ainarchaeum sp.]|nr:glycosyltransferase family 4 protein [Candidatus ainarchaeum sp.]
MFPHSGGISSHISSLKKELERRGYGVDVLSLSSLSLLGLLLVRAPSALLNRIDRGLGYIYRYPALCFFLGIWSFFGSIFRRYELIHCHDVVAYSSTLPARKLLHMPIVLTLHGYLKNEALSQKEAKPYYAPVFDFFESLAKNAPVQLAADTRIRDYLVNEVEVRPSNVRAYRNFVDASLFELPKAGKEEARSVFKLPKDKKIIFCPRRLVVKNGVINAIRAMAYLPKGFLLAIAGIGPEEQNLRAEAKGKEVVFLGAVPNERISQLYRAADYTVIPSVTVSNVEEATSISAIESMASGTPVIASGIGGLRELITDGKDGILVPQADPKMIAKAILKLEKDTAAAAKIIASAKEKVKKELSSEFVVGEFITLDYSRAVKGAK